MSRSYIISITLCDILSDEISKVITYYYFDGINENSTSMSSDIRSYFKRYHIILSQYYIEVLI